MSIKLSDYFSRVDDPRSLRNQRHPFIMLIGTTLLALLSGIDSFSGISEGNAPLAKTKNGQV